MTDLFDITIKAIVRDDKIIYHARAEKEISTGQHTIWFESEYIEDALKGLDREIKRIKKMEKKNE